MRLATASLTPIVLAICSCGMLRGYVPLPVQRMSSPEDVRGLAASGGRGP